MTLSGQAAIAGVYEHPLRWAPDKTEFQLMAESARGALDDCGLTLADVDGLGHPRTADLTGSQWSARARENRST